MSDLKILIVDDALTMRKFIALGCKNLGFSHVYEAGSGSEAWLCLQKESISLILCDWHMRDGNGLELLRRCRQDANFKNIPFIVVTAEGEPSKLNKLREAGVTEIITKPIAMDVLKQVLTRVNQQRAA